MRCPFFLSKNPFRNRKKTPRFDMCFLFLSCVGLSHPKYMFSGFLLYVVFSASFYRKNVSNQKMCSWRLQNIFCIQRKRSFSKKVAIQVIHINNI